MSQSSSQTSRRYVAWASRHSIAILGAGLAVFLLAGWLTTRLELHTAFHELLPSKDPGVVALMKTQERMGYMSLLTIGVKSPDKQANIDYAERIAVKLRALPKEVSEYATYHIRDLREFFEHNKWLYLPVGDLEDIRDQLRKEIGKRKNPLLVDLSDDEEGKDDLEQRIEKRRNKLSDRFPDGYFASPDGKYLWVIALPPGGIFAEHGGDALYQAALSIVAGTEKTRPDMSVEVTGPVVSAVRGRQAVERDIVWVTLTCLVLVAAVIGLYFRRWRAIPLIGAPACLGTIIAFGVAEMAFGHLNASTAFLGSIIVGNGINYGIILMARYQERRVAGEDCLTGLEGAIADVVKGTLIAAVCASAAYGSLTLTSFRGFSQFGVMGAVGVLCCWVANFTLLPAMLSILDRRAGTQTAGRAPLGIGMVARRLGRAPRIALVGSVAITLGAIVGATHFLDTPFEYDFSRLNTRVKISEEKRAFDQNMDDMFGRWPYPTIVLADALDEVEPIRESIRRQDAKLGKHAIGQIVTLADSLPGPVAEQQEKLALIAAIGKLVHDPDLEALDEKDRKKIAKLDPPGDLKVVNPADLPWLARRPFTEVDGTLGRVLLVYPPEEGFSIWNGRDLLSMSAAIQHIALPEKHKTIDSAGSAVVFGAMLRSVLRDGPIATVVSLLVVVLLTLLIMRPMRLAIATVASLLLGVCWMVGAAGTAGVLITFLNFIALPITFGIGAEYALNVMARYRQTGDMVGAVASTGGAVALCSLTTIIGYGSLLAAQNRALQGFGLMAVLGEISCLSAAIIAVPSLFLALRARRVTVSAAAEIAAVAGAMPALAGNVVEDSVENPAGPAAAD